MVVSHDAKFMRIRYDQSFLLKLVSVPEADESTLREAKEVNPVKVVLQFKCKMLLHVLIMVKFVKVLVI